MRRGRKTRGRKQRQEREIGLKTGDHETNKNNRKRVEDEEHRRTSGTRSKKRRKKHRSRGQ